ncbi:class I SAM-dependent methyltransferase [Roseateles sp. YR242]|uniref:class I SAM-dependent methyltransferase n=1 Tax=Roseateles sp. YR242 TaxID=1855305 RepID=UPI0038571B50
MAAWLRTPPGRYLLGWEQSFIDAAVVDLFGFHAVQLGLPQLEGLRANRMPHRWLALNHLVEPGQEAFVSGGASMAGGPPPLALNVRAEPQALPKPERVALYCEFEALPFEANSLDLVVLPHTLELASDSHRCLREVERVLRPEGRVVILGLNPASLWALRQNLARVNGRMFSRVSKEAGADARLYLPAEGEYIGYWRLRDWLRLLSFEVERAAFGCYRPPLLSQVWLDRWQWLEKPGSKWWTVLGALYGVVAVKRVHGMRLVGMARKKTRGTKTAPAVALNQQPHQRQHEHEPQ